VIASFDGHHAGRRSWASHAPGPRLWDEVLGSFERYLEGGAMAARQAARAEVVVSASPEEAFEIFTSEIGLWWRRDTPYWNDAERGLSIRIEPHVGGRFIEVWDLDTGTGLDVGRVTAWEPGARLALTWTQLGWPEGVSTEIEITFEAAGEGTVVRVEQTGFERVPDAERYLRGYDTGWKEVLGWFSERVEARRG
jgi:uncharacterized protein YndB with AHSA1/START domain